MENSSTKRLQECTIKRIHLSWQYIEYFRYITGNISNQMAGNGTLNSNLNRDQIFSRKKTMMKPALVEHSSTWGTNVGTMCYIVGTF